MPTDGGTIALHADFIEQTNGRKVWLLSIVACCVNEMSHRLMPQFADTLTPSDWVTRMSVGDPAVQAAMAYNGAPRLVGPNPRFPRIDSPLGANQSECHWMHRKPGGGCAEP